MWMCECAHCTITLTLTQNGWKSLLRIGQNDKWCEQYNAPRMNQIRIPCRRKIKHSHRDAGLKAYTHGTFDPCTQTHTRSPTLTLCQELMHTCTHENVSFIRSDGGASDAWTKETNQWNRTKCAMLCQNNRIAFYLEKPTAFVSSTARINVCVM